MTNLTENQNAALARSIERWEKILRYAQTLTRSTLERKAARTLAHLYRAQANAS